MDFIIHFFIKINVVVIQRVLICVGLLV
jgi:hypothetical protein